MINPIALRGNWTEGFALDIHILESIYIGENAYGHPKFDTKRSKMGELVYQLKYKNNQEAVYDIMNLLEPFLKMWDIANKIDVIIPIPPSDKTRNLQPVFIISKHIGSFLKKPVYLYLLDKANSNKIKDTNINDKAKSIKGKIIKKKKFKRKVNLLLVDDLYQTGTTLHETCSILRQDKNIKDIYVLAMTKTRR